MIATKFTTTNNDSNFTTIDEFSGWLRDLVGIEYFKELTYIRSDAIIDGIATPVGSYYWEAETKSAIYMVFHRDLLDAKSFQLNYLSNDIARSVEHAVKEHGWSIKMESLSADPDPEVSNFQIIDHPTNVENIRPSRRTEISGP